MNRDLRRRPQELVRLPAAELLALPWPFGPSARPIEGWRSRHFIVQVYAPTERETAAGVVARVGVQRTNQLGGITWDHLQEVKRQIGRGDAAAVELYPPEARIVAVANMRWLWILAEVPAWAWGKP